MKVRATSQYCITEDYDKKSHDDDAEAPQWPSSQECKPVCAWHTFWGYWADNYPNIKVRAKGADTCSDCLKLLHSWKSGDNGTCVPIGEDDGAQQEVEDAMDEALKYQQAKQHAAIYHVRK